MNQSRTLTIALLVLFAVLAGVGGVWYFLLRPAQVPQQPATNTSFGGLAQSNGITSAGEGAAPTQTNTNGSYTASQQKIFKLADGPVAGATFIQTLNPTTTLARYVMATDGHAFDMPVGVSGAVAKTSSNTTIPGVAHVQWAKQGSVMLLQYLENGLIKTLSATFPESTSTVLLPVRIQFLPDNIASLAVSPDGASVAYLLEGSAGVTGYIAAPNGASPKKLFSLPLSEITLSWPSPNYLLAQEKPAAGVPGIAFSVNAKTGAVAEVVYAPGLSAIANAGFSQVVYQTVQQGSTARQTFVHDVASGKDAPLSFQPLPEKCRWSPVSAFTLFCAVPLSYVPGNYLDLWHQGAMSAPDSIASFNTGTGLMTLIATPGGADGGVQSDVAELAVSPDGQYLLFVTKGDRSLWAVRLQ